MDSLSRAPLTWLLVLIVTVPVAAAAADYAHWATGDDEVALPPLVAGETYHYDVTVRSSWSGIEATAERLLTIRVGNLTEAKLADGTRTAALPITLERGTAPWDAVVRPHLGTDTGAREVHTERIAHWLVRVEDGAVLVHEESSVEDQWYTEADSPSYHHLGHGRTVRTAPPAGLAAGLATFHAAPVTVSAASSLPWHDWLQGAAPQEARRGTIDGAPVVGMITREQGGFTEQDVPACTLPLPDVTMVETPAVDRGTVLDVDPDTVLAQTTVTDTWFGAHALPVHAACETSIRAPATTADGDGLPDDPLARLRLEAHLAHHEPGTVAVPIKWVPDATAEGVARGTAQETTIPGRPDDPQSRFRFSLADAWDTMAEERTMKTFLDDGPVPAVLLDALYAPRMPAEPCMAPEAGPLGCRPGADPSGVRDEAGVDRAGWRFLLMNADEQLRLVWVEAHFADGTMYDTTVEYLVLSRNNGPDVLPGIDRLAARFVPPTEIMAAWLGHQDHAWQDWATRPGSSFHVHFDQAAYGAGGVLAPTYMVVLGPDPGGADGLPLPAAATIEAVETTTPPDAYPGAHETCLAYGVDEDPVPRASATLPFDVSGLATTAATTSRTDNGDAPWLMCWEYVAEYDATDGVLRYDGHDHYEACDERPEHPAVQTTAAMPPVVPVPSRTVPLAALAGGVLALAAVAMACIPFRVPDRFPAWAFLPLYAKLSRDKLLKHDTRDEIIAFVEQNPGVVTEEIRAQMAIGWGTVVYHLSALEHHGHLVSQKTGRHRSWFRPGTASAAHKPALAVLRSAAARRVFETVRDEPGLTQQEVAERIGVTHGAVIFQANRLQKVDLLRKEREGRHVRYFPGEEAASVGTPPPAAAGPVPTGPTPEDPDDRGRASHHDPAPG